METIDYRVVLSRATHAHRDLAVVSSHAHSPDMVDLLLVWRMPDYGRVIPRVKEIVWIRLDNLARHYLRGKSSRR